MPRPAQIDRESVLSAALDLADADGLAAVSMRAVADRLGVTPMALYRHVGDKDGLLDGLVERLLIELPPPDPGLPWRDRLALLAEEMRITARRHPQVFPLLLLRSAKTVAARKRREAIYQALRDAGVADSDVPRIERVLSTFALAFATSEAAGRFSVSRKELDLDMEWFGKHILDAIP
jgi:AcrR family transcriptional regulator